MTDEMKWFDNPTRRAQGVEPHRPVEKGFYIDFNQGAEEQYLAMLYAIKNRGVFKGDRTGTGTQDLFGYQLRMDLQKGFPLLTTKKMFTRGIFEELLWFMRGDTHVSSLQEKKVKIWDSWHDEHGELGPIYSHQWRNFGGKPRAVPRKKPQLREGVEATYLDVANGSGKEGHVLAKTWEGMIARCYDTQNIEYPRYGGRGVIVDNRWLEFATFAEDAEQLPGWREKKADPRGYVLDKDGLGYGFNYGPDSCQWVTPSENALLKSTKVYTVEKDGEQFLFTNPSVFCAEQGIDDRNFSDLWTGRKNAKNRYGFKLISVEDQAKGVDQLQLCLDMIRTNPFSRRIILDSWNPVDLPYMGLPPCHVLAQFSVRPDENDITKPKYLDCQLYQRSSDVFLGVPFNIASYALLTHIMAGLSGLVPGEFVHTFGSVHIYNNHRDQVEEQLRREPYALPTLRIKTFENTTRQGTVSDPTTWSIDNYLQVCKGASDFVIDDYQHHPKIKAKVSV